MRLWDKILRKPSNVRFLGDMRPAGQYFHPKDMNASIVDMRNVERYMCDEYEGKKVDDILANIAVITPPHPFTFFECQTPSGIPWGILVMHGAQMSDLSRQINTQGLISALLFEVGKTSIGCAAEGMITYDPDTGWFEKLKINHPEQLKHHQEYNQVYETMVNRFVVALVALDLMNVRGVEVISNCLPDKQRKRHEKRYRFPASTWHTIRIDGVLPLVGEPKGGTHTSPRQHRVRSHWRVIEPGTHPRIPAGRYLISSHLRGNAARGTVKSDYEVSPHDD